MFKATASESGSQRMSSHRLACANATLAVKVVTSPYIPEGCLRIAQRFSVGSRSISSGESRRDG